VAEPQATAVRLGGTCLEPFNAKMRRRKDREENEEKVNLSSLCVLRAFASLR
jgi:hypothetical protein